MNFQRLCYHPYQFKILGLEIIFKNAKTREANKYLKKYPYVSAVLMEQEMHFPKLFKIKALSKVQSI